MRLLYITAGAAKMYCGSCLRDNALAAELISRGHDVELLPIYTPTRTDEVNVSRQDVFLGGINLYLEQYVPIFRRTPWFLDRLLNSKLALRLASRWSISTNPKVLGELTLSILKGEDGFQRKEIQKLVQWLLREPLPDVVSLPNSLLIGLAAPLKRALGRPICCTLQGEDLFISNLPEYHRREVEKLIRDNIKHVDAFIAVSQFHADSMARYLQIPDQKLHVVPLGIKMDDYESKTFTRSEPFTIGYFARVTPEKGLHLLAEAYRYLRQRGDLPSSRLTVAGYLGEDSRTYLQGIQRQMELEGLGDEFDYLGALNREDKIEFLGGLDVLSVPATYDEPKGIFLLEAMASGVPVVQPRRGAFPEILGLTSGGVLVEPDDKVSLAKGILSVYQDIDLATELSTSGQLGVREHYHVGLMADRTLDVFENI